MKRLLAVALTLSASACVGLRVDTRIERGATLQTFEERGSPERGGIRAKVALEWPTARIELWRFDRCPIHRVEEFEELRITERTSQGGFAALGMGVTTALLGGGLLLGQPLFSEAPNTRAIDSAGRYGPSPRQQARGFGIGLLVLGIPTLASAALQLSASGETTETVRRQQRTALEPVFCNEAPIAGQAELLGTRGPLPAQPFERGLLVEAAALETAQISGVSVNGEDVQIDAEDWERLAAFDACAKAPAAPENLGGMELAELRRRVDAAQACADVPGAPGAPWRQELEQELALRRGAAGTAPTPVRVESFEQALEAWPPVVRIPPSSIEGLRDPGVQRGLPVLLRGKLVGFLEANIAVLQVDARELWLYLDAAQPWAQGLEPGAELEVLGLVMGQQEVGALQAPLVKVRWLRPAPREEAPERERPDLK